MPIKGLTDRQAAFPQIGDIRKGKKATKVDANGRTVEYPVDLDYFRVKFDVAESQAMTTFVQLYGPNPREIDILLPFNKVERNFDAYLEAYVAGGLIYRSDGERVLYWIDHVSGERKLVNGEPFTPHAENPIGFYTAASGKQEAINAKPTGRLKVLIPGLQRLAFLVVHTTSKWDVINLTAQLDALKSINGSLSGVPLKLRRRKANISTPTPDGKRARREKWLLSIEADPQWVSKKLAQMQMLALPTMPSATPLIAAPEFVADATDVDDDEGDDLSDLSAGFGALPAIDIHTGAVIPADDVAEAVMRPAPSAPPAPAPKPASSNNGAPPANGKKPTPPLAGVVNGKGFTQEIWNRRCAELAASRPDYADKYGKPNYFRIRGRAHKIGFPIITYENYEVVLEQLANYKGDTE